MTKKEYSTKDFTVVWQPDLCIHSAICAKGLPQVFDPNRRPWIDLSAADAQTIVDQVAACPSGALSIKKEANSAPQPDVKVQLMAGGPLIIKGSCMLTDEAGQTEEAKNIAICRCTKSQRFPYCDGSHNR